VIMGIVEMRMLLCSKHDCLALKPNHYDTSDMKKDQRTMIISAMLY
jgi:hypothetical protein